MTDQGQGGGFTPLTPIGGPSLEDDEKAFRSGRGRMIAGMLVAVLAAAGGLAWFVTSSGPNEYGQLGRQINGMRGAHFDAFWGCVLPRQDLRNLRNNQQLVSGITERARPPRVYAQHVRGQCMVLLDEHVPALDALIVPEDLAPGVAQLRAAIEAQREGWRALLGRMDAAEGSFDADAAAAELTAITRGWHDYKVAHGGLNDVIRTHVTD
jgi:hypothetical protein